MKELELYKLLESLLKKEFWQYRYITEIKRIHNLANSKQKPYVKRVIAEAIAAKTINGQFSQSYKKYLTRHELQPYSIFMKALFVPHMYKELVEVLKLAIFSDTSISTGSRKAVEIAMKSYPKAIGWNAPGPVNELLQSVRLVETFVYEGSSIEAQNELAAALTLIIDARPTTSAEIATIKAYSTLSRLQVQTQGTDLHPMVEKAFSKIYQLI